MSRRMTGGNFIFRGKWGICSKIKRCCFALHTSEGLTAKMTLMMSNYFYQVGWVTLCNFFSGTGNFLIKLGSFCCWI